MKKREGQGEDFFSQKSFRLVPLRSKSLPDMRLAVEFRSNNVWVCSYGKMYLIF